MNQSKYILALFLGISTTNSSATEDENFNSSLASCLDFASKFQNTCDDLTTDQDFADIASADITCENVGACPESGSESGSSCTFQRKLCVSCFEVADTDTASTVKIRSQTNGMPGHCYKSPRTAPAETEFDYTVTWMSDTPTSYTYSDIDEQDDLNSLLCNIFRSKDSNIPLFAEYEKASGSNSQNTGWGIATSGIMIYNGISGEGVDPFYPAAYGDVTDPSELKEKVDWCLAHPQVQGMFHYHAASTCLADPSYASKSGRMDQDILEIITEAFTDSLPYRSALGISKDGRPIYTPFHDNGQTYGDCDVDICNGMQIGGEYAYVSTLFHPYIMGCYGPGSSPNLYQQCSTNPRLCGVEYGAAEGSQSQVKLAMASLTTLAAFMLY